MTAATDPRSRALGPRVKSSTSGAEVLVGLKGANSRVVSFGRGLEKAGPGAPTAGATDHTYVLAATGVGDTAARDPARASRGAAAFRTSTAL
jgi:hypothetical protein